MALKRVAERAEIGQVGNRDVDAEHLLVGEHDAAVDGDRRVAVLEHQQVEADLAETAERDHAQGRSCLERSSGLREPHGPRAVRGRARAASPRGARARAASARRARAPPPGWARRRRRRWSPARTCQPRRAEDVRAAFAPRSARSECPPRAPARSRPSCSGSSVPSPGPRVPSGKMMTERPLPHLLARGAQALHRLHVVAAIDDDVVGVPQRPAEDRHLRQLLLGDPAELELGQRSDDREDVEMALVVRHEHVGRVRIERGLVPGADTHARQPGDSSGPRAARPGSPTVR